MKLTQINIVVDISTMPNSFYQIMNIISQLNVKHMIHTFNPL